MPAIKTKRTDILRQNEIHYMLKHAQEPWVKCLIALLWIFGKRITETLRLKGRDLWVDSGYLFARFTVLKKPDREAKGVPKPYIKRINLKHPLIKYVLNYMEDIPEDGFIFASVRSHSGHISRQHAYNQIKATNPQAWCHLFRESLATKMAEQGATEEELMHWFDWDRFDTAHEYVKHGTKLTEKWADREF